MKNVIVAILIASVLAMSFGCSKPAPAPTNDKDRASSENHG